MNNSTKSDGSAKNLNRVIKIDEQRIQSHLGDMVRSTVEETLNQMLDAEAGQLCNAGRYERSAVSLALTSTSSPITSLLLCSNLRNTMTMA